MKKLKISLTALALLFSIGGTVLANAKTARMFSEQCRTSGGTVLPTVPATCNGTHAFCCTGIPSGKSYLHQ